MSRVGTVANGAFRDGDRLVRRAGKTRARPAREGVALLDRALEGEGGSLGIVDGRIVRIIPTI